jgi:hypothetical protein
MLIFKGYQENKDKLPIVIPSSADIVSYPIDFYVKDASYVYYIVKETINIGVHSHDNAFASKDIEMFRNKCEHYCNSLKNGEYVIDFAEVIVGNSKIPYIIWKKVKNVIQYNKADWHFRPDKTIKQFLVRSTIGDNFYVLHAGFAENHPRLLFTLGLARHQCLLFTDVDKKQTTFGKVLTLMSTSNCYNADLELPTYLDETLKITPVFKTSLSVGSLNKLKELSKLDDEENRIYIVDKDNKNTACFLDIIDVGHSDKDTLLSSFLNKDEDYVYYTNVDFPLKLINDVKFTPEIKIIEAWQTDFNAILIKLDIISQDDKVLITTFFEQIIVEFFDELTAIRKSALFKEIVTKVLSDKEKDKIALQTSLLNKEDEIYSVDEFYGRMF